MNVAGLDRLTVGDHVLSRGRVGTVTFATHHTACIVWPDGDSTVLGPCTPLEILATFSAYHQGRKSETHRVRTDSLLDRAEVTG
jgi:hypothetical protein